ncbi:acyloxyacyl hydrolase [Geminicoccus harenae]|uniref:acyloxyacyl hydrolase n=1 Tax=Geminicoccus harenae TaxID=2498453 RepID=UPI001C974B73|nr:acyloxyacyl hydrolase [Geminicoccus harenae]
MMSSGLGLPALAEPYPAFTGLHEVRAGVYAHDLTGPAHERDGVDLNGEILFKSPGFLAWAFAPRPRLGGTVSTNGGTSLAYADLGWTIGLTDRIFADLSIGGAIHDGSLGGSSSDENAYGCRVNFHETLSLGYRVAPAVSVMLSAEHMSNAGLCDKNDGLTNLGIRLGYGF